MKGRVGMRRCRAIAREAAVAALSQPVVSVLTLAVVTALCAAVLVTTGSAEGGADRVLSSLDASGTRSIVVRAEAGAGLDTTVLDRLHGESAIEWSGAFGFADDVTNAAFDGGARVAARRYYGTDLGAEAMASTDAARELGFAAGVGTVVSKASGQTYNLAKTVPLPGELAFLAPMVLIPAESATVPGAAGSPAERMAAQAAVAPRAGHGRTQPPPAAGAPGAGAQPVAVLVVRASSPAQVGAVAAYVTSVLGVDDPTTVTVQTSEQLAAVRAQVEAQLSDYARTLTLAVFGAAATLVAAILLALVMLRRRDFGRRRALGASRAMIAVLLLTQVGLLGVVGVVLGVASAFAVLIVTRQPQPTPSFTGAVAVLCLVTSLCAALAPALIASSRDPLRELRVA